MKLAYIIFFVSLESLDKFLKFQEKPVIIKCLYPFSKLEEVKSSGYN